jgi:hypothetical protein
MICFDFIFIRLSRSYNSRIVFNRLTQVDLVYFFVIFLIKIFINFIVQHWIRQCRSRIEIHDLF